MSSYPFILLVGRCLQGLLALPFMACVAHANANPKWWAGLLGPTIWCMITGITCVLSVGTLTFAQIKNHVVEKWWKGIALDVLNFFMFVISLALLVKPVEHKKNWSGFVGDKAPSTAWHTAAALAAIEILLFAISTFIMWRVSSRRM